MSETFHVTVSGRSTLCRHFRQQWFLIDLSWARHAAYMLFLFTFLVICIELQCASTSRPRASLLTL